jgi:outer membrane protein TolC
MKPFLSISCLVSGLLFVGSCAGPSPDLPAAPPEWLHAPAGGKPLAGAWWKPFGDPALEGLIRQGLDANPDIEIALRRIEIARVDRFEAMASFFPKAGIAAGYQPGREQNRTTGFRPDDLEPWRGEAEVSWEIDVTGKLRARAAAANAGEAAAFARWQGVRLLIATEIAAARFEDVIHSEEIERQARLLKDEEKSLGMTRQLLERGLASSGDQASRLAELERLRREVSELTRIRDKARLRLARLCGGTPAPGLSHATPQIPPIPTRMPAAVWSTRPDLIEAEAEVRAAFALEDSARLDLLPSLSLGAGGSAGKNSLTGQLKTWELSAGPRLEIPIWDPSRMAELRRSKARAALAASSYRAVALNAVEEIEGAYLDFTRHRMQLDSLEKETSSLLIAWNDAKSKSSAGTISFFEETLSAKRYQEASNLRSLMRLRVLNDYLLLVRSLGG